MVKGQVGEGRDGMRVDEVTIANQEATGDFDLGMHERGESVERVRRFEMIAITGAGGGEEGIAFAGLKDDGLRQGNIAKGAVQFGTRALRQGGAGDFGWCSAQLHETDGMGSF